MKAIFFTLFLVPVLVPVFMVPEAYGRPVSYPGGFTIMQKNEGDMHALHLHYSPSLHYSIGYRGETWRDQEWDYHSLQLNYLAKRWNKPASQANVYIKSSLGLTHSDITADENGEAASIGVAMDWETRRFFTHYENRFLHSENIDGFFSQKARLGIAPYLGDYGDLHTWLMLQFDHVPENEDQSVSITPLVRLFKAEYLFEFGSDKDGHILFNVVVRL